MANPFDQFDAQNPFDQFDGAGAPVQKFNADSKASRFAKGLRDPVDGGAQLLTNLLPSGVVRAGDALNNWIADKTGLVARLPEGGVDQQVREAEAAYQQRNAGQGFDAMRLMGNVLNPANVALASKIPAAASLAGRVGVGAAGGAATSALNPVASGDYLEEKAKQIGVGALGGGVVPAVTGSIARVVSPNASLNPNVKLLKSEGVTPTVGQALGGVANKIEEKLANLPIMGDAITVARRDAVEKFNKAAINRATKPIGVTIPVTGQEGIARAGNALSQAYDDAIAQVKFVKFDPQFDQDFAQLRGMASGLTGPMRNKFNKVADDIVNSRMSGAGAMLGETYKKVDSELGTIGARYRGSAVASEKELGDAVTQLKDLLQQQMRRSNKAAAEKLDAADLGWANLVRIEGAGKLAKNGEGRFTPGQLNTAIQTADRSTRKRAVARGEALMQDLGNASQQVLGDKVPDSGTTGRALMGLGALGSAALSPAIPAGLLAGGAMYLPPMRGLLSNAVSARPQAAQSVADALRKTSPALVPLGAQVGLGLLN